MVASRTTSGCVLLLGYFRPDGANVRLQISGSTQLNPFTTGNSFLGTKLLGFSMGRGSGALKGLKDPPELGAAV